MSGSGRQWSHLGDVLYLNVAGVEFLKQLLEATSSFAIKKAGLTLPTNQKSETSDTNI